jgi:two-component system nitrate/nitrite response regulator NarL
VIRLLVASDVRLYREGLVGILGGRGSCEIVGTGADRASTLERATELEPDVALVDETMAEACKTVRTLAGAGVPVVIFGVHEREDEIIEYAEAGVAGYVTRDSSLEELVEVLESVARGETLLSPRIAALLLRRVQTSARPGPVDRLTPREAEILRLIDDGLSNKQIARRLTIELPTVKNHVHSILEKLEVKRRGEAAARVRQSAD